MGIPKYDFEHIFDSIEKFIKNCNSKESGVVT